MNRPWLTLSLIGTIVIIGAFGIRHAAHVQLERGLSRFEASLPQGVQFSYGRADTAILARGVTLHDVMLQDRTQTFRAAIMQLGHPETTADGGLSVTSLKLRDLSFQDKTIILQADAVAATHLTLPPDTSLTGELTDIDLAHIALASGRADHITLQNVRPTTSDAPHVFTLGADTLAISDYGPTDAATNVSFGNLRAIASLPANMIPGQKSAVPLQITAATLSLTQSDLALKLEAIREHAALTTSSWGRSSLSGTNIQFSFPIATFKIDTLTSTRSSSSDIVGYDLILSGLHTRFSDHVSLPKLDGQHATFTSRGQTDAHTGKTTFTSRLTIPSFMTLTQELHLVTDNGLPSDPPARQTSVPGVSSLTIGLQGERLVTLLAHIITHTQKDDPSFDATWHHVIDDISNELAPNPGLAAVTEYLTAPANRTLSITFTPPSPVPVQNTLRTLENFAIQGALLDSRHLTATLN